MRVTNKMLANNFLTDMNVNLENLKTLQQQMSSGKNFRRPSDDPFNVARAMQMHTAINANTQYNKNITNTINWLDTTDTALGQLNNVFQSIRERLVSAGNAAYGSDERTKIKDEINQRIGQIAQILNTNFDGEYIFGGTKGASKPVDAVTDINGNTKLVYRDEDGNAMEATSTIQSQAVKANNWSGKNITFDVTPFGGTTSVTSTITLDTFPDSSAATIDDVVKNINDKINNYSTGTPAVFPLQGKIQVEKTSDGKIKFSSATNDTIKISSTTVTDIDSTSINQPLPNIQMDMIGSKKKTEVSQGVFIEYNCSAIDIIKYGTDAGDDLRSLLSRIVNHLDGKNDDGTAVDANATSKLANVDISDMDAAMSKLLKVRSDIGAKQNRMDSAKEQNEQANTDMTEILSKTEDIDITEKTMEYATMQTVYMASLQTSARVLQPTLMDYLR